VMVLGTFHMNNPGRDVHNMRIDPVTVPGKQAELAAVADALARFRPTAVAIESVAPDQLTMLDAGWPAFRPEQLLTNADERAQLGYRLAARAGISRVYAIDEKDREGQPTYFPMGPVMGWVQANGRMQDFQATSGAIQASIAELEALQRKRTIGQLLGEINTPSHPMVGPAGQAIYYSMIRYGAGNTQPGADLNARWYARNVQIFARLVQVAKPGDRIVIVYGAGHAYWLRHFVSTTPGFELVEPTAYLSAK
jgi:Family of unknown function (DUF5694)